MKYSMDIILANIYAIPKKYLRKQWYRMINQVSEQQTCKIWVWPILPCSQLWVIYEIEFMQWDSRDIFRNFFNANPGCESQHKFTGNNFAVSTISLDIIIWKIINFSHLKNNSKMISFFRYHSWTDSFTLKQRKTLVAKRERVLRQQWASIWHDQQTINKKSSVVLRFVKITCIVYLRHCKTVMQEGLGDVKIINRMYL